MHAVFELNQRDNAIVKEFLPAAVYDLLHRMKSVAAQAGYKDVCKRSGSIFVRETDGSPVIVIGPEAALTRLESAAGFTRGNTSAIELTITFYPLYQ